MKMEDAVRLAERLVVIDQKIEDLEADLGIQKAERKALVERELPTAMRDNQMTEFKTDIGNHNYTLAIKHKIVGALSRAPDVDEALAYLAGKGFSGASKATVSVTVEDSDRDEAASRLEELGVIKVDRKVNHMTLAAFARECISDGTGFDLDKVGLTTLVETTIKENLK